MRLARFYRNVRFEFGDVNGPWIVKSHVLRDRGATAAQLIEQGVDPREVWEELARDFDVPESRLLGPDD